MDQEHDVLVAAGHQVERFERDSDDIARRSPLRRAMVPAQIIWSRESAVDLDRAIDTFHPDVVHVHNLFPLISPSVLQVCQRRRVPCVVTIHNYRPICAAGNLFRAGEVCRSCVGHTVPIPAVRHGCYRESSVSTLPLAVANMAHRQAWRTIPSAYVFLSAAQQRELEPLGFPTVRCFVKPNFVPLAEVEPTRGDLIVYLGRLAEEKGLRQLMRAWDRYLAIQPVPRLRLAVAGAGPLEDELRVWAAARPSVSLLGLLDRQSCTELVSHARAVVAPSEWPEPFGLVVAEAMVAGVATIATDHGSFSDLITDGVDGLLYPPRDVDALARLLRRADDDPVAMEELGRAARTTHGRRFDPARNVAELENIYRFAIANPRWRESPTAALVPDGLPKQAPHP